ncbi:MAG TPA: hypothetical protein VD833_01195, partial [Vicinamibacterales bacterium]|nr:hypothetical protein [Vicinamibacterales bacterium]
MTDEKQSGTEPQPEAIASEASPASEERVAAVAVADEPAAAPEPATAPDDTTTPAGESDETAGSSVEPVTDSPEPADAEPSEPAESVVADTETAAPAEPVGQEADAPADAPDNAPAEPPAAVPPAAASVPSVVVDPSPMSELTAVDMDDAPTAADEPPAPPRDLGPEPTTMEELLAEQDSDIKSFKHGDVVEGTVVRIDKDEILVDIGAKSEG